MRIAPLVAPSAGAMQASFESNGLNVPLREAFKSTLFGGTGDVRAAISKAKSAETDLFMWIGYESDVIPMTSQLRELNVSAKYIFGTPPGWPLEFSAAPEAECVLGLIGFLPSLPTTDAMTFTANYRAMHNADPDNYAAALAYAQLWAYADAINAAGTTEQAEVIGALERLTFRSPMGEWSFGQSEISPIKVLMKVCGWSSNIKMAFAKSFIRQIAPLLNSKAATKP
ncbi:MAG: ABC transporter substrate-binding protein [Deinococcales bacterium]